MLPSAGAGLLALGVCLVFSFAEWVRAVDIEQSEELRLEELRRKSQRDHWD